MYLFSFVLHVSVQSKNTSATANHESGINYLLKDGKPAPGVENCPEYRDLWIIVTLIGII